MKEISIGSKYTFQYPPEFVTWPEYTEHAGQVVEVTRALKDPEEYEGPSAGGEAMFEIKALDGWTGQAWESELKPINGEQR